MSSWLLTKLDLMNFKGNITSRHMLGEARWTWKGGRHINDT